MCGWIYGLVHLLGIGVHQRLNQVLDRLVRRRPQRRLRRLRRLLTGRLVLSRNLHQRRVLQGRNVELRRRMLPEADLVVHGVLVLKRWLVPGSRRFTRHFDLLRMLLRR